MRMRPARLVSYAFLFTAKELFSIEWQKFLVEAETRWNNLGTR